MAINTTAKRQAIAQDLVQHATAFREVLFALRGDADKVTTDALTFQDSDFAAPGLNHLDAATINALLSAIPTIEKPLVFGSRLRRGGRLL